jgi:hypothetical protein
MEPEGTVEAGATSNARKRKTPPDEVNTESAILDAPMDNVEDMTDKGPAKPEILNHLVLGINETIKSLERAIDDLKFTLLRMGDALNGTLPGSNAAQPQTRFLPTAPAPQTPSPPTDHAETPLEWIIIPLQSINPQTLVSPIPQYCATYNSLVYQHLQLGKAVRGRLKEADWNVMGEDRLEVRVVPLGSVEGELAAMVGLRRLACLGIRVSTEE